MNVLFIVTWYSPKDITPLTEGIFHYEQVLSLSNNCDIRLLFPYDKTLDKDLSYGNENGINVYRIKYHKNRIKRYIIWIKYLKKIIKEFQPDLIHAQVANCAGFLSSILSLVFKIPYVITEHNPIELLNVKNRWVYLKNKFVYKHSFGNFCVSPYLKDCLKNVFKGIPFDVIYNGVIDPKKFVTKSIIENEWENCVIVASFYDKDIKGFQYLLPAIKQVLSNNKKIKLHICGGGKYLQYYKDFVSELGIEDYVIFYGQCEKRFVYKIINSCNFLISASLYESAGVTIEEALLLGKPVLVTNSGGANSLVNEANSIVVNKGDVESLVNGILQMIEEKNKYNAEEIRKNALKIFEINNISQKYLDIYNGIIK